MVSVTKFTCSLDVGLKPDKGKINIKSKCLLNNLTLIQLIYNTARSCREPVGRYIATYLTRLYIHIKDTIKTILDY